MGTIPNRTIKIFKNRILNLNNPGQELNTNKIHRANYLKKNKKQKTIGHIKVYIYNAHVQSYKTSPPPIDS